MINFFNDYRDIKKEQTSITLEAFLNNYQETIKDHFITYEVQMKMDQHFLS